MDVKKAVVIARDYFINMMGNQPNLMLEEVEISEEDNSWYVTFSFSDAAGLNSRYKVFHVGEDGIVRSMKVKVFN